MGVTTRPTHVLSTSKPTAQECSLNAVRAARALNGVLPASGIEELLIRTARKMWINPDTLIQTFWLMVDSALANEDLVAEATTLEQYKSSRMK